MELAGRERRNLGENGRRENNGERGRSSGPARQQPARHRVEHTERKKGKKPQGKT